MVSDFQKTASFALRLVGISVAASIFGLSGERGIAGESTFEYPAVRQQLPEILFLPISGQLDEAVGWRISYRNGYSGADAPVRVINSRAIVYLNQDGKKATASVTWQIERTTNSACIPVTGHLCPDMIKILSVPPGYIAVPESAVVKEGSAIEIHIVPNVFG